MQADTLTTNINAASCDSSLDVLAEVNLSILGQFIAELSVLSEEVYTRKISEQTSSIGMHLRHVVEFYQAFLRAVSDGESNALCYDNRQRNLLFETSKESAIQELEVIRQAVASMTVNNGPMTLSVIIAPSTPPVSITTTFRRELYHLLDHSIHHMALIKLIAEKQNITLAEGFGLAKSTEAYQQRVS
jgi:uncharacterized damage-inducible protein DinB